MSSVTKVADPAEAGRPAVRAGLPQSSTSTLINLLGLVGFVLVLFWCKDRQIIRIEAAMLACLGYAIPIIAAEVLFLRTPWAPSTGLDFSKASFSLVRISTKLVGLYGAYAAIAFCYWLFPEYRGATYQPAFTVLKELLVPLVPVAALYVAFVDRHMKEPEDGLYHLGRALLLRYDPAHRTAILQVLLGWIVKAFFWPIMFGSLAINMENMMRASFNVSQMTFPQFFTFASTCLYTADVLAAVVGYVLALRLIDTHIRSTEPTASGWAICMMCYPPFLSVFINQYLAMNSQNAIQILTDKPVLQAVWGCVALILLTVYAWASIAFGCRFSNITHRGLISNGPYRFTKHPAYVCKTTFWWVLHAPFIPMTGLEDAVRYSIMLTGVTIIYYLRAKTEERHMSHDPAYVAYALAMNRLSVFAGIARLLPFLRYRAPAGWQERPVPYTGLSSAK